MLTPTKQNLSQIPKNKQKKRRIINEELLKLADNTVKDDGVLFIATDIPDYMMWILRIYFWKFVEVVW